MIYDDRIYCDNCRHLRWQWVRVKLPPLDPHGDPRTEHRVESRKKAVCNAGRAALPNVKSRCSDYEASDEAEV